MIDAKSVAELRSKTGAGMMDCKKALTESNGDLEKAIDYLREKGIAKAAKKESRIAAEGLANIFTSDNKAVILEVNSETDFVSKNAEFTDMIKEIGEAVLKSDAKTLEEALLLPSSEGTIADFHDQTVGLRPHDLADKTADTLANSVLHNVNRLPNVNIVDYNITVPEVFRVHRAKQYTKPCLGICTRINAVIIINCQVFNAGRNGFRSATCHSEHTDILRGCRNGNPANCVPLSIKHSVEGNLLVHRPYDVHAGKRAGGSIITPIRVQINVLVQNNGFTIERAACRTHAPRRFLYLRREREQVCRGVDFERGRFRVVPVGRGRGVSGRVVPALGCFRRGGDRHHRQHCAKHGYAKEKREDLLFHAVFLLFDFVVGFYLLRSGMPFPFAIKIGFLPLSALFGQYFQDFSKILLFLY